MYPLPFSSIQYKNLRLDLWCFNILWFCQILLKNKFSWLASSHTLHQILLWTWNFVGENFMAILLPAKSAKISNLEILQSLTAASCACCLHNQSPLLYHTMTFTCLQHVFTALFATFQSPIAIHVMEDNWIVCSRGWAKWAPPPPPLYSINLFIGHSGSSCQVLMFRQLYSASYLKEELLCNLMERGLTF